MKVQKPWLVQRCELVQEPERPRLLFDYMGASEFEWGAPKKAMEGLFQTKMVSEKVIVKVDDFSFILHLVAKEGFDFKAYAAILQNIVDAKDNGYRYLCEPSYMKEKIQSLLGTGQERPWYGWTWEKINVWFDLDNEVMIALSQKSAEQLVSVLNGIKQAWAAA